MNHNQRLIEEKSFLLGQLQKINKAMDPLPQGELRIEKNGKYEKWIWTRPSHDGVHIDRSIISKADKKLASSLALKRFLLKRAKELQERITLIDMKLKHLKNETPVDNNVWKELVSHSSYVSLISRNDISLIDELAAWQTAPYKRSSEHPEHLTIEMQDGTMCRSKSERLISDELIHHAVPYRYECEIHLNGITIYPDFIVRNRRTGKMYIWEHFGKIDDEKYFNQYFIPKMRTYIQNGYIPGINLIITFETQANPLNISEIRNMIEQYLI